MTFVAEKTRNVTAGVKGGAAGLAGRPPSHACQRIKLRRYSSIHMWAQDGLALLR